MTKLSKSPQEMVHIPDLDSARTYYASVFDAEFASGGNPCEMVIGDRRFLLSKEAAPPPETHAAKVRDADVSVARIATRGGEIVDPVAQAADTGERHGAVRDAFGHVWTVTSAHRL
ncbi:MAG: hypothetical protein AAFN79_12610 [Pseudomonadota bacterium]